MSKMYPGPPLSLPPSLCLFSPFILSSFPLLFLSSHSIPSPSLLLPFLLTFIFSVLVLPSLFLIILFRCYPFLPSLPNFPPVLPFLSPPFLPPPSIPPSISPYFLPHNIEDTLKVYIGRWDLNCQYSLTINTLHHTTRQTKPLMVGWSHDCHMMSCDLQVYFELNHTHPCPPASVHAHTHTPTHTCTCSQARVQGTRI